MSVWYNYSFLPNFYLIDFNLIGVFHRVMRSFEKSSKFTHHTLIEIVWTVVPAVILVFLAIPSFNLLYGIDEVHFAAFELRIIGHQWYWSYETALPLFALDNALIDFGYEESLFGGSVKEVLFDSYPLSESDLSRRLLRNLEVDARLILPVKTYINAVVTATDVLHSWAVPSLGVKLDAIPGRLNQTTLYINREGIFYGQCSEICGINHGFMPIVIQAVSKDLFLDYLKLLCYSDFFAMKNV